MRTILQEKGKQRFREVTAQSKKQVILGHLGTSIIYNFRN